jgi:DNA-binding LytR/AlgR family response regulator
MKIRFLIVDDEPLAQRVLEKHAADVPWLEFAGKCGNALDAMNFLHESPVDLMFLDINMPTLSGMDLLKTLKKPPLVIITTAYPEHALEGYEWNVLDYLVKPVSFERFLKAAEKAQEMVLSKRQRTVPHAVPAKGEDPFIFIKSSKKTFKVNLDSILYIEALGDYVKVFTAEKMIVTYQSLKNIETLLPPRTFPRIHKSFIISLPKVEVIEGNHVKIRDRMIPIGTNYKADFEKLIVSI